MRDAIAPMAELMSCVVGGGWGGVVWEAVCRGVQGRCGALWCGVWWDWVMWCGVV